MHTTATIRLASLSLMLGLLVACQPEAAPEGDHEAEVIVGGADIAESYAEEAGRYVSPVLEAPDGSTRAGVMLELAAGFEDRDLALEARPELAEGGFGDWIALEETFREEGFVIGQADFGFEASGVQVRLPAELTPGIISLTLAAAHPERAQRLEPSVEVDDVDSDIGAQQEALSSAVLRDTFGSRFRSRAQWGAGSTRCVSNPSKNRIAIHHTASGASTTDAAIRGFHHFHTRTRGWCDIAYHFLITRDGKVYEGVPFNRLGTHVRGHNTGNVGISLVGCFDSGACGSINRSTGSSAVPSETMIRTAGELVGLVGRTHRIALDTTRVRGHRQHSGHASNTCPGNNVLGRFGTILSVARGATPPPPPPPSCERDDLRFTDIGCSPHRDDILWLAGEGLTNGCSDRRYCPGDSLTRGQAATFLARALELPAAAPTFSDVAGHPHAASIGAVAAAGITAGCGGDRFCPDQTVTRGQLASFLARGLNLPSASASFSDVPADHAHAGAIGSLSAVGITNGCAANRFCPADAVNRGQMAAFMRRAVLYHRANCGRPSSVFTDIGCSTFRSDIEWIAESGISAGCSPLEYCPDRAVTRGQLATFLTRALDLPPASSSFADVPAGSTHAAAIGAVAAAGITAGCGGGNFCPDAVVTRAQLATFLTRALDLPPGPAIFEDVPAGSTHAEAISAIARAGITSGCAPSRYCPDRAVERGALARFFSGAFR